MEAFTVESESGKIRDELIPGKVTAALDGKEDLIEVTDETGRSVGARSGNGLNALDT